MDKRPDATCVAVDMLVKYCADNGIGLKGTLVFTIGDSSYVDQVDVPMEGEEEEDVKPY